MSPEEQARADAKRKAAEDARKRRVVVHAQRNAALTFEQHTGYAGKDEPGMKQAFRRAALRLHPDRGGDASAFAELSAAWDELQRGFA